MLICLGKCGHTYLALHFPSNGNSVRVHDKGHNTIIILHKVIFHMLVVAHEHQFACIAYVLKATC